MRLTYPMASVIPVPPVLTAAQIGSRAIACCLLWLCLPMPGWTADFDRSRPPADATEPGADMASVAGAAGGGLSLSWWTLDGGGGALQSDSLRLEASIGQPDANPGAPLTAGERELRPGYWTPAGDGSAVAIFTNGFEID